ncbi:MAG: cysteine--tRNA ligase [Deltaproteobacteria bacterium]|nr:cysteine--tRNA ligase [Deltaproteobacteria bacterium]
MALSLYDTAARKKTTFVPLRPGRAGIYTCGPTVYRYAHIGNLRTYLLTDLLIRSLRFEGIVPFAVQNITDMGHMHEEALDRVEDKVIAAARAAGKTGREIAEYFTEAFFADCRRMNFLPADVYPRASAHVPEMIAIARELERRGAAYREGDYVYFDVARAKGYGELSGARLGEGEAAERTDVSIHRRKRHPEDFTLWLPAEPGREFSWDSPWGRGWPGWHIECAAMALKYLGDDFDIHVGGSDLRFPHHENSRSMAMTATDGRFAGLWMHAAHLLVEGHKMSKSMKNEYTLDDLSSRGVDPMDFRYYCLTLHYRTPMNFTWEGQAAAAKAFSRLKKAFSGSATAAGPGQEAAAGFRRKFRESVEDDLNLPKAVGVVHEAAHAGLPGAALRELAAEWDTVLGLGLIPAAGAETGEAGEKVAGDASFLPAPVVELVERREAARKARDFKEADTLRDKIRETGYDVVDEGSGPPRVKKIVGRGNG